MADETLSDRITVHFDHRVAVKLRQDVAANHFKSVSALVNAIAASYYGETDDHRLAYMKRARESTTVRKVAHDV